MELAKIVPQANKDATREDYLRGKHPCDNAMLFLFPIRIVLFVFIPTCYSFYGDAWSCLVFTPWSWASRYSIKFMIPFSEKKRSYGQFSTTTGAYRVKQVWSSTFFISGIHIGVFPSALIDTIWPACQQTFDLYPRFDTDFEAVLPPAIYLLFLCG